MKLEKKDTIAASQDFVYELVRDRLSELVPHLPNVERIEVLERKESPGKVHLLNHWFVKVDIPGMVKKFLKPEYLSWKDRAVWDDAAKEVRYDLEAAVASGLFSVKGVNRFVATGPDQCELIVSCTVEIYPEKIPGVPRILAGTIKGPVEDLIKLVLEPNLTSLSKSVQKYLSQKK